MSTHNVDVLIAHCRQARVNHRIRHLHYDSFIDVVREVIPAAAAAAAAAASGTTTAQQGTRRY
jgi:hypothetical protein